MLPPENTPASADDDDWTVSDGYDSSSEDEDSDPSAEWPEIHSRIKAVISELGGSVSPKLNWSAPKDATWISATNSTKCKTANDVYLLLKSSNFITHDLEHAFDGCVEENGDSHEPEELSPQQQDGHTTDGHYQKDEIPYHLVLRKYVNVNPSLEFRCFVRNRRLIALCQRDTAYYAFLHDMQNDLRNQIQDLFDLHLCDSFPDPNFVFDVYIPPPHNRVWLIDINPWAERTDPILFSWRDILDMEGPRDEDGRYMPEGMSILPRKEPHVRVRIANGAAREGQHDEEEEDKEDDHEEEDDNDLEEDVEFIPWFTLVGADGPSGMSFTSNYSAHKLPKDVVDASQSGTGGMTEFLGQWKDVLERRVQEDRDYQSGED